MENLSKIPRFSFDLSGKGNKPASILVSHFQFDEINDVAEFLRELGYTDEIRRSGMLPDEFIWVTYTRNGAAKSAQCLQPKIIEYLFKYSDKFRKEYGNEYVSMIGKCVSEKNDDSELCVACPMHSRFLYSS